MSTVIHNLPETSAPLGPVEYLDLTWEERCKPRRKFVTTSGTELALSLNRGTILKEGMIVYNAPERTVIVRAKSESVFAIKPINSLQFCQVAHNLGNWHRSLQVTDDAVLTHGDDPLAHWLRKYHIEFAVDNRPYEPNLCSHAHD
ncbi:MAG TPA: hypothetical protein V6D22_04840 [Candidatus Obscuribacterales bacterium]